MEGLLITFSHRSLQEFLGSFNFTKNLDSGEKITAMVAPDEESPVFMVNPLFLHFCLWFVLSSQTNFTFEAKDNVHRKLLAYTTRRLGSSQVDLESIGELFPALDMKQTRDSLSAQFYQSLIKALDKPKHLIMNVSHDINSILLALGTSLRTLESITLYDKSSTNHVLHYHKLAALHESLSLNVILEDGEVEKDLRKVLRRCSTLDVHPAVFIFAKRDSDEILDMSTYLREDISKFYLLNERDLLKLMSQNSDDLYCPHLTNFVVANAELHESVLFSLNEAAEKNFLPKLTHLSFVGCKGLAGKLLVLFQSEHFSLTHLDLRQSELSNDDLRALSARNKLGRIQLSTLALSQCPEELQLAILFENVWSQLSCLVLHCLTQSGCIELSECVK